MSIVVTGSLAYDHIMTFQDEFRNHIMPEKTHLINVAFNVDSLKKDFGGTAGNIAYNLKLLGQNSKILATVGEDFTDYENRIILWQLSTEYIKVICNELTAQAFITTDLKDNQITAFYGGAMYRAEEQPLSMITETPDMVIIAANSAQAMIDHAKHCQNNKWNYIFDPGQAMTVLSAEYLRDITAGSELLVLNDYEWQLFQDKTALAAEDVLKLTQQVIVTLGAEGVDIINGEGVKNISAVDNVKVIDPTGSGDAFRAGLIYGIMNGFDIEESCKYACAVASFALEYSGTQNHVFDICEVEKRRDKLK